MLHKVNSSGGNKNIHLHVFIKTYIYAHRTEQLEKSRNCRQTCTKWLLGNNSQEMSTVSQIGIARIELFRDKWIRGESKITFKWKAEVWGCLCAGFAVFSTFSQKRGSPILLIPPGYGAHVHITLPPTWALCFQYNLPLNSLVLPCQIKLWGASLSTILLP